MIAKVNLQTVLLGADGLRVAKRQTPSAINPLATQYPNVAFWSMQAPILKGYVCVLSSLTAHEDFTGARHAAVSGDTVNGSYSPGYWELTVKFYYMPAGNGGECSTIFIDAFDIQAAEFFGDNFLDAKTTALADKANNGVLNDTGKNQPITYTAKDVLKSNRGFSHWQVSSQKAISVKGPTITVNRNDIIVAIACYHEIPLKTPSAHIPPHWIYNRWLWVQTHGGIPTETDHHEPTAQEDSPSKICAIKDCCC